MTILIQAAEIAYAHGSNQIFENTSFVIHAKERAALIGDNGSGKSTLFRLMTRELTPQAGTVTHRRSLSIGWLRQESALDPALTVRDTVARAAGDPDAIDAELREVETQLGGTHDDDAMAELLDRHGSLLARLDAALLRDPEAEIQETLGGLGLPQHRWSQRVGELSGGERKLVEMACLTLESPDVLLLDEPDTHFDVHARAWLERWLTTVYEGAVCVISHDRYLIDQVATTIFELEHGEIRAYHGNYSAYVAERRRRIERELELRELAEREYLKLKHHAEQITQWARQNPKFATRAEQARRKRDEERARLDAQPVPVLNKRRISLEFTTERGSTDTIVIDGAEKTFGERVLLRPFDLLLRHGERAGMVGPNGAGKSTLVRMILGQEPTSGGTLRLGSGIVAGYQSQLQETLDHDATPMDTVRRAKALNEQQALSFLLDLQLDRTDASTRISDLSGGERTRLQIGLLILSGANLLILDEPTNNLDIASVEVLEAALLGYPGTILTISHDRYFLDTVCTRIIELNDGEVRDYAGSWSWYAANRQLGSPLTRDLRYRRVEPEPARHRRR